MGIWRKVGHALFPAIVPSRSRADKAKSDFKAGRRVSGKAAERYAQDRKQADDDARAAAKARREATKARREGIAALDRQQQPKGRKAAEAPYRQAWMEHRLSRPGRRYADNFEFFNNLPMMRNEDEDTRERLWRSYLDNMVSGRHRRDSPSNPFWRESGISPRDFDWDDWRESMGYGKD
jgi:hypothetical protein